MEMIQFKTTIKCSGCVSKVTPFLNDVLGEDNWEVDYSDPSKVLTVCWRAGCSQSYPSRRKGWIQSRENVISEGRIGTPVRLF